MAIQKQGYNIPFGQGLDTKTDPFQVAAGKMLALNNVVFRSGALNKRNGFGNLSELPVTTQTGLATLNGNLLSTGPSLYSFNGNSGTWQNQGPMYSLDLNAQALVRSSLNLTEVDAAVASNGLVCTVFISGASSEACFQISDSTTGAIVVGNTAIESSAVNPRVFITSSHFVISYRVSANLKYKKIPITEPTSIGSATTLWSTVDASNPAYDGAVMNNQVYFATCTTASTNSIEAKFLNTNWDLSPATVVGTYAATYLSLCVDTTTPSPTLWVTFNSSTTTRSATLDANLNNTLAVTTTISGTTLTNLTSSAYNGTLTIWYADNATVLGVTDPTIRSITCTSGGTVGSAWVCINGLGLASKAFLVDGNAYFLTAYGRSYQPSYFLVRGRGSQTDTSYPSGEVVAKIAYSNGGGYITSQVLPSISSYSGSYYIPYLAKALLVPVNRQEGSTASPVYTQTGINIVSLTFSAELAQNAEIAQSLHLNGGFLWQYDGVKPVEHGFHIYPEGLTGSYTGSGGNITTQQYYYVAVYEWTDGQGFTHRSAPSVPLSVNVTSGSANTTTVNIPRLRVTAKWDARATNNVRIVLYRWSTAQPIYYQVTSITSPQINYTYGTGYTAYSDTAADSSILGNNILYTTGGVIENIGAPACAAMTMFKSRLFVVDAEDRDTLWYSKQVIEDTPVEMSDLLTVFVAPSAAAQGATGPVTALAAMDDKLIIFKSNSIYYMTGNGPDNTGASNDFSTPVFITSSVGCSNPNSMVVTPQGIMFQSDKGIWLLGRDLSTNYIGAAVEAYNNDTVVSALTIPNTNEVRFNLSGGTVLLYDYYYAQWGTFSNIPGISSVLYDSLHTYLASSGIVRQETPNEYLDGSQPVLMSFTTAWLKLTNLQGFQRAYFIYLLGKFLSPHTLQVSVSYDYEQGSDKSVTISPDNSYNTWGDDTLWGNAGPWGGTHQIEQWRVFLDRQKCQSIQLTVQERYSPSSGVTPGAGVSLSGINVVFGAKGNYPSINPSKSVG